MNRPTEPIIKMIRQRALLLRELRRFFDSRGFLEVQPPCLSRDCVVDAYIDPIEVPSRQFAIGLQLPATYYLQTSPEAAMNVMILSFVSWLMLPSNKMTGPSPSSEKAVSRTQSLCAPW